MQSGFGFHRPLGTWLIFSVVLLALAGLATAVVLPRAAGGVPTHPAVTTSISGLAAGLPTAGQQRARVALWLTDQSALRQAQEQAQEQIQGQAQEQAQGQAQEQAQGQAQGQTQGQTQRAATRGSATVKNFAAWEHARNDAARRLAASIGPGVRKQQRTVAARLRALGASIESTSITPNVLTVTIAAGRLRAALALPGVAAIEPAPRHKPLTASVIDGSPTWHAAGCTGAGALDTECPPATPGGQVSRNSPDGNGGPDVGIYGDGINLFHGALFAGTPGGRNPRILTPPARDAASTATDPCPAEPEVDGYRCGYGTLHGNAIAAILASTDNAHFGMAPGIDKLLDSLGAAGEDQWFSGVPAAGDTAPADLPEATVYAAGTAAETDDSFGVRTADLLVSLYGIARSGAAGNDGPASAGIEQRVSSPCIAWNTLCMGGMEPGGDGRADDTVAGYSSRGPSPSGRKKPDLLAYGRSGCPSNADASSWIADCGEGTSFAAARGAAAQALLASSGVTDPIAQRAVLINSAFMVPSQYDQAGSGPASYWTPDAGWGELALENTFTKRGFYEPGSVTGSDQPNSARFFRIADAQAGERVTLAWNRRVRAPFWPLEQSVVSFTLTNLDLYLYSEAGDTTTGVDNDDDLACAPSATLVEHCGVDQEEHSENTGPHPVAADAWDNVEQVRAKNNGLAIAKVKAASPVVDGGGENFAIAGEREIRALGTPTIGIAKPALSAAITRENDLVTVSAALVNESAPAAAANLDLNTGVTLNDVSYTLNLPAGVEIIGQTDGLENLQLEPGESDTLAWTVRGTRSAVSQITVSAKGKRFGETFETTSPAALLTVDSTPPTASLKTPRSWQPQHTATISWTSTDGHSQVTGVEVQKSIDNGPFEPAYAGGEPAGTVNITADEGQFVRARVRATDAAGNTSAFRDSPLWAVDAEPPAIELQAPSIVTYGDPAQVTVRATNVGSPVQAYVRTGAAQPFTPVTGETLLIASVAKRGNPLIVEAQALDSLNRIVRASTTINTRPRKISLRMKTNGRRGRKVLTVSVTKQAPGTLTLSARCGRDRLAWEAEVSNTGIVRFSLSKMTGRCGFAAKFTPQAPYQDRKARGTQIFRL